MNELDNLRNEVESVESFKTVFQGYDKKRVNEVFSELTSSNRELEQRNEELLSENESLKKRLRELQKELADREKNDAEAQSSTEELSGLRLAEKELNEKIATLEKQLLDARDTIEAAEQLSRIESSEKEALKKQAEESEREIASLKKQLLEAPRAADIEAMKQKLSAAEAAAAEAVKNAEASGSGYSEELRILKEQLSKAPDPDEFSELQAELEKLRKENAGAKSRAEIDAAKSMLDDLKSEISRLNEEKRKKSLRIAELEDLLQEEKDISANKIIMLTSLNRKMSELLDEKLKEVSEIAVSWRETFDATAK
ncbi:MAG: hypothetical protein MJ067_02055 [Oscillospiraceae bacterium]|nr:hypothetical protein [Oscillospiraceae bacterium]